MEPQRLEIESEAWYRAVAEGRLAPASDLPPGQPAFPAEGREPPPYAAAPPARSPWLFPSS